MDEGWLYGEWETGPWWAFHDKVLSPTELRSFSHLRMNENLDPLNKTRRKRAVLTVGLERGSGCAVPRSSGGTPAFSSTSYGCISLIRDLFLNIVLQGVPKKKVVNRILRTRFLAQKTGLPTLPLKFC